MTYPDYNQNVSYTYDSCTNGIGHFCAMQDEAGTTTYAYDARGNRLTETADSGVVIMTLEYAYNDADQLTQITYPSGRTVDYARNALGQIEAVTTTHNAVTETLASNLSYQPFGPLAGMIYGNGLSQARTFDLDYRVTALTTPAVLERSYSYAASNNLTAITDVLDSHRSQDFGYDGLNRLTAASGIYGTLDYNYDANGNRLSEGHNSSLKTFSYDLASHHLVQTDNGGTITYSYDASGNTVDNTDHEFIYGDNHRLQQTQISGFPVAEYVYNGKGERVRKTGAETTLYYYDPSGLLLAELDGSGATLREYVYREGEPLAQLAPAVPGDQTLFADDFETEQGWQLDLGYYFLGTAGAWERGAPEPTADAGGVKQVGAALSGTYALVTGAAAGAEAAANDIDGGGFIIHSPPIPLPDLAPGEHLTLSFGYYYAHAAGVTPNSRFQVRVMSATQTLAAVTEPGNFNNDNAAWTTYSGSLDPFAGQTVRLAIEASDHAGKVVEAGFDAVQIVLTGAAPTLAVAYYANNPLGTPQVITDASQQVVWQADYEPFGRATVTTELITNNLRFPGQYFDAETGLHHNGFRPYDPGTGRYIQSDPIGLAGGLNTYTYVDANPIVSIDLFGLVPNPAEAACTLGPNPICIGGLLADIGTTLLGGSIVGSIGLGGIIMMSEDAQDSAESQDTNACPVPGTVPGRKTKGRTKQFGKPGDFGTANTDFDNLNPTDVRPLPNGGRSGKMPNGDTVNVRPGSTDGRPTIEIQSGKRKIKIRYGS